MVELAAPPAATRWPQLWLGVVCMILIANLQYSWTLFVSPLHTAHGWDLTRVQVAFTIFVAAETWFTPACGWLADHLGQRRGPSVIVALGGVLVAAGWIVEAYAASLVALYAGSFLAGAGAAGVYATCVGNAVKWFPDKRGLAVGLTAAGFGAGAALTVVPVQMMIAAAGYSATFLWFGLGQGALLLVLAPALHAPPRGGSPGLPAAAIAPASAAGGDFSPRQVLGSPVFWLLYVMFVMVAAAGLMVTAQIAPIAKDLGLAKLPLLWGASALSVALVVDNVMNGLARPFFGFLSDRIGREKTMGLAFSLGAVSYWLLAASGHSPWLFVLAAALVFFTWGEIFSLFPSTCTDLFGSRYASANAGLLYTAKGLAVFLVPFGNVLASATGNWTSVFAACAAANVLVVFLALFVLRPIRRHRLHAAAA
jgi:OFA family oxalate/formate antiporter-like MFS transporter